VYIFVMCDIDSIVGNKIEGSKLQILKNVYRLQRDFTYTMFSFCLIFFALIYSQFTLSYESIEVY